MSKTKAELFSQIMEVFNGEKTSVEGIEIFNLYENTHKIKFTEQDMEDMVKLGNENISSGLVKPNLKVSHSDEQIMLRELLDEGDEISNYEELPCLATLTNLRAEGKSIFADVIDIPVKLKNILFSGKYFRSISPEIVMDWRETGKKLIKAISLTNKPSLKHISDVHMSEALSYDGNLIVEEIKMTAEEKAALEAKKKAEDLKASEGLIKNFSDTLLDGIKDLFNKNKGPEPKPEDKKKTPDKNEQVVPLSEVMDLKESFESQINELKTKLIDKDDEQKKFFADFKEMKATTKKKTAEAICAKALTDGVPKSVIDYWKPVLMSETAEAVVKFSKVVDEETIDIERPMVEMVEKFFEICPGKVQYEDKTATELFSADDDAMDKKMKTRISELKKEGKSQHEAISIAGEEFAG